jgi:hypothetical protein
MAFHINEQLTVQMLSDEISNEDSWPAGVQAEGSTGVMANARPSNTNQPHEYQKSDHSRPKPVRGRSGNEINIVIHQ